MLVFYYAHCCTTHSSCQLLLYCCLVQFADPCNQYLSKENVLGIFGQGLGDDEESAALEQCWNQGNFAPAPEATAQFHFASDLDFNVQDASLGMFYECVDQIHRWASISRLKHRPRLNGLFLQACQRFVENSLNSCQPVLAY